VQGKRLIYSLGCLLAGAALTAPVAGERVRTDRRGRAVVVERLRRPGRYRARATRAGMRSGSVSVRAVRRAGPRFTG